MTQEKKVGERVTGRWKSVLVTLGINERILDGSHHPCPVSGEGDDRFRFSNKSGKGNFFCACNDGRSDGFKLLECMNGWDFKTAAAAVEDALGDSQEDTVNQRSGEDALRDLRGIQRAITTAAGDANTRAYLSGRGIDLGKVYQPGVLHDARTNYGLRKIGITAAMDAMAAKVVTHDGQPSTFHLTYLHEGCKAQIERSRVVATPFHPMAGGAVRLMRMRGDGVLGVGEGIETAYSAAQLFDVPTWATLNAQQLEKFQPPEGCRKLVIFSDNDENFTGQAAAYALAKRAVMKFKLQAEVRTPLRAGMDWNDVLTRGA